MRSRLITAYFLFACTFIIGCAGQPQTKPPLAAAPTAAATAAPPVAVTPGPTLAEHAESGAYPAPPGVDANGYPYPVGPTATPGPSPTPGPTFTPSATLTPAAPTITAFPARATPTQARDACDYHFPYFMTVGEYAFPTPDVGRLAWVVDQFAGRPTRRLTGLEIPLRRVDPSPYGSGLALQVARRYVFEPGGLALGLLVTDGPGSLPWLAIESWEDEDHAYQWLPDGRLIWIDQGQLYTARADGSQKILYPLPEVAFEVWSNGSRAVVSGDERLWRVNLATKEWREIKEAGSISFPSSNAALMPDLSELLVNNAGRVLEIPFNPNKPVTGYEPIQYSGGGGRIGPPQAIGSRYVFPGIAEFLENGHQITVFKRGKSQKIALASLLTLPEDLLPVGFDLSPDGDWISIAVNRLGSDDPNSDVNRMGTYLARADDLKNGTLLPTGETTSSGWRTDPPAYFIASEGLWTQVDLPSLRQTVLGRSGWFLTATRRETVAQYESQFAVFDPQGSLRELVDMPFRREEGSLHVGADGTWYLIANQSRVVEGQCTTQAWVDLVER